MTDHCGDDVGMSPVAHSGGPWTSVSLRWLDASPWTNHSRGPGRIEKKARAESATKLLEMLWEWERAHRAYHLVGHSHGGSVIWAALREATKRAIPLIGLKSWSTVGTPFIQGPLVPTSAGSILKEFAINFFSPFSIIKLIVAFGLMLPPTFLILFLIFLLSNLMFVAKFNDFIDFIENLIFFSSILLLALDVHSRTFIAMFFHRSVSKK